MSASPFRSHLLQQWARSNPSRPPAVMAPWLKNKSSAATSNSREESSTSRSSRHQRHARRHHHQQSNSSRNRTTPSLSTLDSAAFSSSRKSSFSSVTRDGDEVSWRTPTTRPSQFFASSAASTNSSEDEDDEETKPTTVALSKDDESSLAVPETASSLQSLLLTRRTASRLTHTLEPKNRPVEQEALRQALDRAVQCAQMAPNHKRTEPFSFKRFLASSQAAKDLAEISYQVSLAQTESAPNAQGKRNKWLQIPGFLVALVHDNQSPVVQNTEEATASSPYQGLPYTPPETERQLEDYASACTAVQNVLLSLHAEGVVSKWATGPVIRTPAFRELVQAEDTDRIVALIMVGGVDSTEYSSDREREITQVRRHRRRLTQGDVVVDLA